jgi:flagellar P-ring protein precursor FlgI
MSLGNKIAIRKWVLILSCSWMSCSYAARIKDIANLKGVRDNQLSGYGIVIGLPGTGDKDLELTSASLKQVLKGMGISQKMGDMPTKNVASVLVTAKLPPFAKVGNKIDILVSSIGTASSLEGGTLVMTALKGPDENIYAMAQGKLLVTPKGASSGTMAITAELPAGAILEKEIPYHWGDLKELRYQLTQPDFTTAARMAFRINEELSGKYAVPVDAGTVNVTIPFGFEGTTVELIALIEGVDVQADRKARVVVNSRTSTVVIGDGVRVLPVAVAHGNLSVEVKDESKDAKKAKVSDAITLDATSAVASTPAQALSTADRTPAAAVPPAVQVAEVAPVAPAPPAAGGSKDKKMNHTFMLDGSVTVKQLVDGLNGMGASGEDLVHVLRAIQGAGALQGELEIL